MKGNSPVSLTRASLKVLIRLCLQSMTNASAIGQKLEYKSYSSKYYSTKRKRRNSELGETSGMKRRKLNDDGNYDILSIKGFVEINLENELSSRKNEYHKNNEVEDKVYDPVIVLRIYLKNLPCSLWTDLTVSLLSEVNKIPRLVHERVARTIYELVFCSKLTRYSSAMNRGHSSEESVIFERLPFCRNLRSFDYHVSYLCNDSLTFYKQFLTAVGTLRNLRSFSFAPSQVSISSASSIFSIVHQLPFLEKFSIFYDNSQTSNESNIGCLKCCERLQDISLYSFGKGSEINNLVDLLKSLKYLQFIYHRDLPNALMEIYTEYKNTEGTVALNLKSFVLVAPKIDFGSQLIYIPTSTLKQVGALCPQLSHLTVVKPACILEPLDSMSQLRTLTIHSCDFKETLREALLTKRLQNLLSLRLVNSEIAFEYNDIISISKGCPKIEELEIFNGSLVSSASLMETDKPLFPFIKRLILVSLEVHSCNEPYLMTSSPHWVLGSDFIDLILSDSKLLEILYLEFSPAESSCYNEHPIGANQLLVHLMGNSNLKELLLWRSPAVDVNFVKNLVNQCPLLKRLRQLNLWNFSSPEDEREIRNTFNYLVS